MSDDSKYQNLKKYMDSVYATNWWQQNQYQDNDAFDVWRNKFGLNSSDGRYGKEEEDEKQKDAEDAKSDDMVLTIQNASKSAMAEIHSYGATVIRWTVDGEEQLFVSGLSKWDQSKAIRGGIPIVFPQFGPGKMKQHGFARVCVWTLKERTADSAVMTLSDNELSDEWKAQFPFQFQLEYTVKVTESKQLNTSLIVRNMESEKSFDFTVLFHTYFSVTARDIVVKGLQGLQYLDKLEENEQDRLKKEEEEGVKITEETDRIYMDIKEGDIVLKDGNKKCSEIKVKRTGFQDVVLWNPWIAKSKRMGDFGDEEFESMVCIEPGTVAKAVVINAGESKEYTQMLIPTVKESGKL